ncbi:hypothetical protein LOK49_LG03G00111 [Camellia lanceoleosa]|uniref:Uncharacterized protein n=1 Tax=Camellia lanceoleosa TaxID=1840588 RepID=A0ACC0I7M4_9ERIC|nr:hypothetical protein LOK49_LG03G00111 [Camellia lanceoleosa]
MKGVTAESIKELSDRLEMFKAKAVLDSEVREALMAPLSPNPKWSEIAEKETRSEIATVLPDLGGNQSVRVRDEIQTTIVAESEGVGINDEENRAVLHRDVDYEQVDLVSNQDGDVMSQKAMESGPFGKNFRGGFHGRGRGVRGGRGTYRQESRSWADVASASVRSEEMEFVAPTEVSRSSNVGRVDSGKDCVNTYLEDVVTTTDSTADIVTKEVASLEEEITTKATTQVEASHSDIMDIANLIHPATEIILKEVESKVLGAEEI